ncbi:(2Fe-2S)-binding protein [Clostridium sp.]|uniref:(2Fe-2S)-binding protein n=1 Tax=Clostridium sp. TaxID=1506 RepID=UPI003463AB9F
MEVILNINNIDVKVQISPDDYLVDTLRGLGNYSVKRGCDTGSCGLCSILIDEKPTLSCSYLTTRAVGSKIVTIEGLEDKAREFAEILSAEGAEQCGFCSPGFIITVIAMKKELDNPSDEEIKEYLAGNLCRCTGYMGQMRAVKKYLGGE